MNREKIIETLKEILLVFIVIGMLAGIFWVATLALVYTGSQYHLYYDNALKMVLSQYVFSPFGESVNMGESYLRFR